jgi:hypothetical protein
MPGLRMLLRMAPFVVGALALGVWLRRREQARIALPPAPELPKLGPAAAPEEPRTDSTVRFEHEPIDIVTVVDDLLLAGR